MKTKESIKRELRTFNVSGTDPHFTFDLSDWGGQIEVAGDTDGSLEITVERQWMTADDLEEAAMFFKRLAKMVRKAAPKD